MALSYGNLISRDVQVQHTSLPVDLVIYEKVVPLFMRALGSLANPEFKSACIPENQERYNSVIKRKDH